MTSESFEAGNTYYSKITIVEDATGKSWTSQVGSFSLAPGATSGVTVNFTSGLNMGGSSPADGPEPTSGLLLLVGAGILGLRRKRA